jgi:TPR repeat protein
MRYILFFFSIIFLFSGCSNKQDITPTIQKYSSIDTFNYSKQSITFFENEFSNILKIENINILEEYTNFYSKNKNYFLNGKQKVEELKNRLKSLQIKQDITSTNYLLKKAKKTLISNKKEAIKIYKELANENNIKAQRALVEIYKISNPTLSLKWLEKLVENRDIYSMKEYASSNIYMVRPILVQDLKKAINTYKELANAGELSSIMRLGNIYEYGYHKQVAPQDRNKSLEYYETAAAKGYEVAQKKLLNIYSCKKCIPSRYNEEKAKALQKLLVQNLNKKIFAQLKKEIPLVKTIKANIIVKKEIKKEIKKESKKPIGRIKQKKNKNQKSKIEIIKCYDLEIASTNITNSCKNKIQSFLEKKRNILKIILIPVLDKNDIAHFDTNDLKKELLKSLGKNRTLEMEKYLRSNIENSPRIKSYDYHVISKKENRGFIIKFY